MSRVLYADVMACATHRSFSLGPKRVHSLVHIFAYCLFFARTFNSSRNTNVRLTRLCSPYSACAPLLQVPDGEHFVTDVPGLGDTTVSAQGQVYVDPRWNNDMLSSILHRKGRRLVTGEGCMRFLTSAGIPLTSGQPQSGTGGARRGGETHSSHRPRSVMSSRSTPRSARGGATSNTARVMMSPFGTLSDGNSRRPATSSTNRSSPRRRFSPRERGGGGGGRWSCNEWGDPRIETSASADDVAEVAALPRDLGPSLKQA